jgi:pyruvate formate lyase activating enzyme
LRGEGMQHDLSGIAGWHRNSFIDFPGIVATVLFFSGCNLHCPYCHNPHVVNADPAGEIDGNEVWDFLQRRVKVIDGVVLSGGEPTLHRGMSEAAAGMRSLGYRIKLDTNGLVPEMITKISPDYLGLDIKTLPDLYKQYCLSPYGDTDNRLRRSLEIVRSMKESAEVRITCAPGFVNREIVSELAVLLSGVAQVFLQPMQNTVPLLDPEFAKREPIAPKEIAAFRDILSPHVGKCVIRGA